MPALRAAVAVAGIGVTGIGVTGIGVTGIGVTGIGEVGAVVHVRVGRGLLRSYALYSGQGVR